MPISSAVAVYTGPRRIEVDERQVRDPQMGEVVVEISRCGVCGSDLHLVLEGYARPGSVLGHEWSGHIAALGDPTGEWAIGDRVVGRPVPGCGECPSCRSGRPSVCRSRPPDDLLSFTGAYAQFTTVATERLTRIPEGVDDRAAALTEPLAVALHAVTLARLPESDARALVTGAGPIGLTVVAVLAALDVTDVVVTEPSAVRRERASALGARRVIPPSDLVEPRMGSTADRPVDVAFECSGRADAAAAALGQLDRAGRLVLLGTGSEWPRLNHNRMIVHELSVVGAYNYDENGFDDALALLASGSIPAELLLDTDEVPLAGLLDAMLSCERGDRPAKVLVNPALDGARDRITIRGRP